jgi:inward rectifier potassium channel
VQVGQFAYAKKGVSRFDLRDPYHLAVTLSWPQFMAGLFCLYLFVNLVFAILYSVVPGSVANARPGSLADAFFFSFETLATVGYGEMYPASLYGHVVACAEIVSGLAFTAIMTGLVFVRFSRPRAKFLIADRLVVCQHNGTPTLMVRVGNGRLTPLGEAQARLNVLLREISSEGMVVRSVQELKLLRSRLPIFPLTWTLMHVMDERSPLHGMSSDDMIEGDTNLFLSIEARDPSLAAIVHEIRTFGPNDVVFGMRYVDVISTEPDGTPLADMTKLNVLEPDVGPERREQGWTEHEPEGVE